MRGKAAGVDAGGVKEIEGEIAVAGNVHAVQGNGGETQIAGYAGAIEGKAAAGQRAGTQREEIGAAPGFGEAFPIAREHFEISEQVVGPKDRLCTPHVRIAGNHGVGMLLGEIDQDVFRWERGEGLEEGRAKLKELLARAVPNPITGGKWPV